jgi:hypothetical protein
LADEFANHVRRRDVPGLRVVLQETVTVGHQVDGDPRRPGLAAGNLRGLVPYLWH